MILISLMLAATSTPALKPDVTLRREAPRARPARAAARSKRILELEAVVRSLSSPAAEPARSSGPAGL